MAPESTATPEAAPAPAALLWCDGTTAIVAHLVTGYGVARITTPAGTVSRVLAGRRALKLAACLTFSEAAAVLRVR